MDFGQFFFFWILNHSWIQVHFLCRVFENQKLAVKQCYQTGHFWLDATFWVIFKQYANKDKIFLMARCRFITGLKMQAVTTLLLVLCPFQVLCQDENVVVQLPDLGHIKGRTVKTIGNQGHPQKNYYNFRNIPFAQSVSGPHRFSVRKFSFWPKLIWHFFILYSIIIWHLRLTFEALFNLTILNHYWYLPHLIWHYGICTIELIFWPISIWHFSLNHIWQFWPIVIQQFIPF